MNIIYARIVTKNEERQIRRTQIILSRERGELIPAFDATNILDKLELSMDEIKKLHKILGGSGEANRIILFRTVEKPVTQSIPLRHETEIKKILRGSMIKEVKFMNETRVEPI